GHTATFRAVPCDVKSHSAIVPETSRVVRMKALVGTEMQEARHFRTKAQMPPSGTAAQATGATPLAYQRWSSMGYTSPIIDSTRFPRPHFTYSTPYRQEFNNDHGLDVCLMDNTSRGG
ncbi:hypothetical protein KIN20_025352, partial [Parelaphostrongylus tenuis]